MGEQKEKINIGIIAEALGVSKTTVSRAISGKGRIGEATVKRVKDYIEEHGYKPNVMARALANSKTNNIALVLPQEFSRMEQPFVRESLYGIYVTAKKCDYDVLLEISSENGENPVKEAVELGKVDGCILFQNTENDKIIPFLMEKNIPFVLMGTVDNGMVFQVDHDHITACREMTSIVLSQNMKRNAVLGGDMSNMVNKRRMVGFRQANEEYGVKVDDNLIFANLVNDIQIDRAVVYAMENGVDCIICLDDFICFFVMQSLRKRKIDSPKEIKVVSFYDNSFFESFEPKVSAIHFEAEELGRVACSQLIDIFEGRNISTKINLGYQVILRQTTQKN